MSEEKAVAVVTGGTRGIGREITKALQDEGYKVAAIYQGNDEAAQKCKAETGASVYKADVCDFAACQTLCQTVEEELGPIKVLVNNAGITRDVTLHKMDPESWQSVLDTNLTSCFNMCRAVINNMRANNYGRIINIGSVNGQKGQFGQVNYAAAKAGMVGFTKALALESARKNITVNIICPGYIQTDMTEAMRPEVLDSIIKEIPVARLGQPEEVAAAVAFLVSPKAGFITGATISANGGQYMA